MKVFKSPDPSADAVQVGDRRYPVRGGVFSIKDQAGIRLLVEQGFEEARAVADEVLAQLDPVGVHVEPVEEPAAAVTAGVGKVDLGPIEAIIRAAHERIDALERKLDEHGVFDQKTGDGQSEESAEEPDAGDPDGKDETGKGEGPTLEERIAAVDSHDAANALAAELGVEGFQEKKPGVDAKKKALLAKAEELAAKQ